MQSSTYDKCRITTSFIFILVSCALFGHGWVIIEHDKTEDIQTWNSSDFDHIDPTYFNESCGPVESKLSEEETCYIYDTTSHIRQRRDVVTVCPDYSKPKTRIRKQCRPPYGGSRNCPVLYTCHNGNWIPPYDRCLPDCGVPTKHNEYPWLVAIYDKKDDLVCSGTIISPFHVITTHCLEVFLVQGKYQVWHPEDYLIIAGKHNINIHKEAGWSQMRKIKSWSIENLSPNPARFELMLLEVDQEFKFLEKDEIRPICLDWDGLYEELDFKDGNEGKSIGWEYDKTELVPCKLGDRFNVQYWQRNTCRKNLEIIQADSVQLSTVSVCGEYIKASESNCGKGLGAGLFFKSDAKRYFLRGILRDNHWRVGDYLFYSKISSYYDWLKKELIRNPRIPREFETPRWVSQNVTGCIVPENIEHGKFALTSGNTDVNGKWVPCTTTLLLSCAGTTNSAPLSFRCVGTVWVPSIETVSCKPPGTCPSISSTTSERVICKLNGATVSCRNPPNNATALVRCREFYTYHGYKPLYKCQNGEWDQPFTPCALECGMKRVKVTELIIGGEPTVQHEYPWVVGIYNSADDQICSGTIISKKFVLSAAHCFTTKQIEVKEKGDFTVVAGKYFRDITIEEASTQKRKIKALHIYDDYRGGHHKYRDDIALIEVDQQFTASVEVEPICVDWDNAYEDYDLTDGNLGIVTGWGHTTGLGAPSEILKKLEVPFRDKRVCLENLPTEFSQQFVVNEKICAGYKDNNTGVCKGDSGGGLYFKSDGKRYFIRGITSITVRSTVGCDPNRFTLYTKVSAYLPWIVSIIL